MKPCPTRTTFFSPSMGAGNTFPFFGVGNNFYVGAERCNTLRVRPGSTYATGHICLGSEGVKSLSSRPKDSPPPQPTNASLLVKLTPIVASVCIYSMFLLFMPSSLLPRRWLLTMPTVTVLCRERGLPMAATNSPGRIVDDFPSGIVGSLSFCRSNCIHICGE